MTTKIFCIGFHKTGTTSLGVALRKLGYRVTGAIILEDPDIDKNVYLIAYGLVEKYDAFQDNPWPIIYKDLDKRFPDSKFILTLRDSESWYKSQTNHFGRVETPMRKWIYGVGCPEGNKEIYIKRFDDHNREVKNYFKDRSKDLLVLDLAKGDGWEKLCPFLGASTLKSQFPHANKASDRKKVRTPGAILVRRMKRLAKLLKRHLI